MRTDAELEDAAIPILDRLYSRELKAVIARYDELKPRLATTMSPMPRHAATAGAIEQLLVDLDAVIPGLVSDIDGSVIYSASDDAETLAWSTKSRGARCIRRCQGDGCAEGRIAGSRSADCHPSL